MAIENIVSNKGIIDHPRYITNEEMFVARGNWGKVYRCYDRVMEDFRAIKILDPSAIALEQMKERGLDAIKAIKKEANELVNAAYIVPRKFEIDNKGRPFIVMPFFERFFSDIIEENSSDRLYLWHGLDEDSVFKYMLSLIQGINEVHLKLKRAHCDIKPDNFAVDENGNVLVCDLGTSTYLSYGSEFSRENMGFLLTRAPECFIAGSHPDEKSDLWSIGALFYRLFTGEYPFEAEFKNTTNSIDKICLLLDNERNSFYAVDNIVELLNGKIIPHKVLENIPLEMCDCFFKLLSINPYDRFESSTEASLVLKKTIDQFIQQRNYHQIRELFIKKYDYLMNISLSELLKESD